MGKKLVGVTLLVPLVVVPTVLYLSAGRSASEPPSLVRVGILIYDGVFNAEFIAPLDVLNHAAGRLDGRMRVFTVSPASDPVRTAEGLKVQADYYDGALYLVEKHYAADLARRVASGLVIDWEQRKQQHPEFTPGSE